MVFIYIRFFKIFSKRCTEKGFQAIGNCRLRKRKSCWKKPRLNMKTKEFQICVDRWSTPLLNWAWAEGYPDGGRGVNARLASYFVSHFVISIYTQQHNYSTGRRHSNRVSARFFTNEVFFNMLDFNLKSLLTKSIIFNTKD